MVMEASPSPQSVGREFVRQYYTLLNKAPAHLHRFYNNYSSFVHGGLDAPNRETLPVVGQKQIHNRIQQLNFRDCHAKISQVDSQATLGAGVVVQVTGELSNAGAPMRRFTQTFVLAAQSPKKYYVHNDIFRYQDIVFSDEEGEGDGRSSGSEEEARGYFPPPAFPPPPPAPALSAPPAQAPAPAPAPAAAPAPLQEPPINGHPLHHDYVTALHAGGAPGGGEPEPAAEPEPALEAAQPEPAPAQPPQPPLPPLQPLPSSSAAGAGAELPPEPKTYANLLKSSAAPPPLRAPPPQPPAHAERPRPPRAPRDAPPPAPPAEGAGGGGAALGGRARYADAQQLFLGNVPVGAAEDELRAFFSRFGPVAELRVHSKAAAAGAGAGAGGGKHPNYGFITYESARGAGACLAAAAAAPLLFGAPPDQVKLNVEEKKARARDPRRRPPSAAPPPPRAYRR